jgi:SAM-dependent methyltransferase
MDRMLRATAEAEDEHYWFRGLRRAGELMIRQAAPSSGRFDRIVDCGAGTGRNLDWLGRFGAPIGVELTPLAVDIARAHGRRIVRGSVTALPLEDRSMHLATSFDVLYCLDDRSERQALLEMWRVLVPGGVAIFNVAALDVLRGSHSTLTVEVRRYTKSRLQERLLTAQFEVERMTFLNLTLFPPALAIRTVERLSGRASDASEADLRVPSAPVNAVLDMALRAEAAWLHYANLPIGTSIMAVARKPHRR